MSKVIDEEVIQNYENALRQKYNAVCFDIDGTITEKDSKHIDSRAIELIAELLNRRIPLIFITGRGETGLNDFKEDIIRDLKKYFRISDEKLARIYVLLNDGARLFKSDLDKGALLTESEYLVPDKAFKQLDDLNHYVIKAFGRSRFREHYDITYSKDFKTGRIINIRLIIKAEDPAMQNKVYRMMTDVLSKYTSNLTISEGMYQGKRILQISPARKEEAVKKAEKIIGIPENSMLRIGDRGDEIGNDFTMLDCPQGFSVQETSEKKDCCFPVMDENHNILTGVEATEYLIHRAKIFPTICLESIDKPVYRKRYAAVEKRMQEGSAKQLINFNHLLCRTLRVHYGMNDVFDEESGAVIIPMYEWELIDDGNLLKKFYEQNKNNDNNENNEDDETYENILKDNQNILLRGSKNYYYFLANRRSDYDFDAHCFKDFTSQDDVLEWIQNYISYMEDAATAVCFTPNLSSPINKRLLLGMLDNVRNVCLICINATLVRRYDENKHNIINLNRLGPYDHLFDMYNLLLKTHKMMIDICTDPALQITAGEVEVLLHNAKAILRSEEFYVTNERKEKEEDYSKKYRAYREIDNFAENYLTVKYAQEKNDDYVHGICGISYGGIELPILYKTVNDNCSSVLLLKFAKDTENYKTKHALTVKNFGVEEKDVYHDGVPDIPYIVADDNLLTAKTMQLALNIFYDLGLECSKVLVVRYPSINRFEQMTMNGHGAVDFTHYFSFIEGLLFPSPYSYRDKKSESKYLDSLGVFDLHRKKIVECLFKNHDFKKRTEVSFLKKKSVV